MILQRLKDAVQSAIEDAVDHEATRLQQESRVRELAYTTIRVGDLVRSAHLDYPNGGTIHQGGTFLSSAMLRGTAEQFSHIGLGSAYPASGTANTIRQAQTGETTRLNTGPTVRLVHRCQASIAAQVEVPGDAVFCPFCGERVR